MNLRTPTGMNRRHFMRHLAGASALAGSAFAMGQTLKANATTLKKNRKAAILLWMGGGPSTIDLWDLKPGATTGGPFSPIATNGNMQISEHLPNIVILVLPLTLVVKSIGLRCPPTFMISS